jgi:hypothetical protein
MPQSKPRRRKGHGEVMPPLNVLDRIDALLKEQLTQHPEKGELTDAEIEHWHRDLSPFPIVAIEYAFETHRRNSRYFPQYGDILDICVTWEPEKKYKPGCSRECRARHGKGYNEVDVKNLYKMVVREVEAQRPVNEESLLSELDSKRPAGPPEWRR